MQQNLSGNDVKCCRKEGNFLPKAESGLIYSTTSIYRNRGPFFPLAGSTRQMKELLQQERVSMSIPQP